METEKKITIRERDDLGPVLARADHLENAIEVNKRVFYGLPPMVQEFVLCHEVCHLKHNEWDEARTNELATQLFLNRATGKADREQRERFLSYITDNGGYSNFWAAIVSAVVALGTTVYGIISSRNEGWYKMDDASQKATMKTMLDQAFEQSRRSSTQSAADFLWMQLQQITKKDSSLEQFLNRGTNSWVKAYIAKYEQQYGFKINEVTPIDLTAYPVIIMAIGAAVALIVYLIIKKRKK